MKSTHRARIVILCAMLSLAFTASASIAQEIALADQSRPSSNDIRKWLDSGDSRQIAWAAHFANKQGDRSTMEEMLKLVEHWTTPALDQPDWAAKTNAMSVVLDTLIQRNEKVPANCVSAIAAAFPVQAAILASRLSRSDSSRLFLGWYDDRTNQKHTSLPRIAAMMLVKAPPQGFAASVLAESEERLEVSVQPNSSDFGSGFGYSSGSSGGSCGDSIGLSRPGWPPLFTYLIEENSPRVRLPFVVEAGGDRITYRRVNESGMWGSCFFPRPLNAETRLGLIANMLRTSKKKLPWKANQSTLMFFESNETFLPELRKLVSAEESKLNITSKALYRRGLLSQSEAQAIRPKLSVFVFDDRKSTGSALPAMTPEDSRTSVTYTNR